jgi:hypothetical protein
MRTLRPRFRHVVLALACLFALLLVLSVGRYPLRLHPQCEFLISRGAMELAFCDYSVRSHNRDSWWVGAAPGPQLITALPPRTFWYPTVSHQQLGIHGPNLQYASPVMWITIIHVPLGVPAALLAIATIWVWVPLLRRKPARGLCRDCGYDLTGNTSGVCPECGTPTTRGPALA